jgi:hypothetical protein
MATIAKLDITKDLAPDLTVAVKLVGVQKYHIRLWVARQFIKLAAKIMNCGIKIDF